MDNQFDCNNTEHEGISGGAGNNYDYSNSTTQNTYQNNFELEQKIKAKLEEKARKKETRSKRMKKFVSIVSVAALFGSVSAGAFLGVTYIGNDLLGESQGTSGTNTVASTVVSSTSSSTIESDVATIASNVMPSIVSITNLSVQEVQSYFGQSNYYEMESAGSGIIIGENDTELLILSNNHVIEDSSTLTVTFCNDDSVEAILKGADSTIDLAVIAIEKETISEETMSAIKIATLGDSDSLQVGEPVIAIGNALGYGQSVTTGVVSAVERTISGIDSELIQTDAAINPGNSGGALLNSNGEVIGINTAKVDLDAVEGMGYAIPISDAIDTINALISMTTRKLVDEEDRGYVGIQGLSVTEESAAMYDMPVGVYIKEVTEGGGAEEAGLSKGSIITKIDGITVETIESLQENLMYYEAGTTVVLTIEVLDQTGEYVEQEIEVTLRKLS
ncbi:MAG: trypsin-like peptidase domain-containing protein [Eubacteriales bacterium]